MQNHVKQECIPVGCVPPAHWPYLVVSGRWGLPARGCIWQGGTCPGGVPARGVPARGCTCQGVYLSSTPNPLPPLDRILDTGYWKYYLAPTSLRAVNIRGFNKSNPKLSIPLGIFISSERNVPSTIGVTFLSSNWLLMTWMFENRSHWKSQKLKKNRSQHETLSGWKESEWPQRIHFSVPKCEKGGPFCPLWLKSTEVERDGSILVNNNRIFSVLWNLCSAQKNKIYQHKQFGNISPPSLFNRWQF